MKKIFTSWLLCSVGCAALLLGGKLAIEVVLACR